MPYFIYKPQNIANIGGVFPKTNDDEFSLGLGVYKYYYLGSVVSTNLIHKIKDYFISFLTDDEAEGFKLLSVNDIPIDPSDIDSERRPLNETELANKALANKIMLKLELREKIYKDVGDIDDLIADMSKRIDLIERLVMRIFYFILNKQDVPQELLDAYLPMIANYITAVDSGQVKMRADLEDPQEVFNSLAVRYTTITNLVKTEYFDKI